MQISVFGPLSIVREFYTAIAKLFSHSKISQAMKIFCSGCSLLILTWPYWWTHFTLQNFNIFASLPIMTVAGPWIICTHLFCYVLIDDILFVISFNKRQPIFWDEITQNFVASLLYLTWTGTHTFYIQGLYWVKKGLIPLWNCPPPQT